MEQWSNKGTKVTFIPESDVYRLVMKSKLPDAERNIQIHWCFGRRGINGLLDSYPI